MLVYRLINAHHCTVRSPRRLKPSTRTTRAITSYLLEHWHQAGDLDREFHYLDPVAEKLIVTTADFTTARRILDRGLNALPVDDLRRVSLRFWHAKADHFQADFESAEKHARRALTLAEQKG